MNMIARSLNDLPVFAMWLGTSVALTLVYLVIYMWITSHDELDLIRRGNSSAAVSFVGALCGFTMMLSGAIRHSAQLPDMVIWGTVGLTLQLVVYFLVKFIIPSVSDDITHGKMSAGIMLGGTSIGMGLINSACMA